MFNKIKERFAGSTLGIVSAYLGTKVLTVTALASTTDWNKYTESGSGGDTFANIFNGFVSPLADFAAVILVISAIICGMKIGAAAMTGDSRTRTSSIVGLFFIIIGAVVVIHAREIVGMANNVSIQGQ